MNENPYASPQEVIESIQPQQIASATKYIYRPVGGLLKINCWLAIVALACSICILLYNFLIAFAPLGVIDPSTSSFWATVDSFLELIRICYALPLIAWNTCFAIATYRVGSNAHALAPSPPSYSPAYGVGAYFMPLLNLVRPYQAMKDYYEVCTAKTGWLLISWWVFHLTNGVVALISSRLWSQYNKEFDFPTIAQGYAQSATVIDFIGVVVLTTLAILSHQVLSRLAAKQAQLALQNPAYSSTILAIDPPPMRFSSWGGD